MASLSIKTRLLSAFFTISIFLTISVSFVGYHTFEKTLISEIGGNRMDVLHQVGERVYQMKENLYTASNLYYYDSDLQNMLKQMGQNPTIDQKTELNLYMEQLTRQFQSSFNQKTMNFEVIMALENGGGYCSEIVSESYDYMKPRTKIWYMRMLHGRGQPIEVANYKDQTTGFEYFTVARVIEDEIGNPLAYLMLRVNEAQIHAMYEPIIKDKSNTVYIVDEKGTVISSSESRFNGFQLFSMKNLAQLFNEKDYTFTKMYGEDILFTQYQGEGEFSVLEEIPLRILMEPIQKVRTTILLIAAAAMACASIYAVILTRRITIPLSKLCAFMCQVEEKNLDVQCNIKGYKEIQILESQLNLMLGRIRELMERIKVKEQQKRKMELGFLQAQINPHFMYNTLFSIKCMVDMAKNEDASRMLTSFINLLRSTLSNPNEFVTIRQEIGVLQQYVEIQKFRYDDGFQVFFECDEKLEEKKIPKLLIQPLLENAIFHGVEFHKGEGLIIITVREQDSKVVITVEDNGIGMDPELIKKIEAGEAVGEKNHIGLSNVKERIQLNFGEAYGMKIESVLWEGTKISLILPSIE